MKWHFSFRCCRHCSCVFLSQHSCSFFFTWLSFFFFFNCHLMLHYVCFAFQTAATMAPEKQCFASALGSFSDTDGLRVLVLSHSRSVHYKQRPDRIRRVCEVCIRFLFPHAASLSGPVFLCPVLSDSFFFFFFFR